MPRFLKHDFFKHAAEDLPGALALGIICGWIAPQILFLLVR